jgi:PTH1 family peptidyl-tRNA hydrolase
MESAGLVPAKLVAGLGNPGRKYQQTPHNLGFWVLDQLARDSEIRWEGSKEEVLLGRGFIGQVPLLLVKPQAFMNLSGEPISKLLRLHGLSESDLIVFCDDLALPWGRMRIRAQGSSGGHKGLESIIHSLRTEQFTRIRLGIAPDEPYADAAEYVLSPILPKYRVRAEHMVRSGVEALKIILSRGIAAAMSEFNR